jgi:hypothetical protein
MNNDYLKEKIKLIQELVNIQSGDEILWAIVLPNVMQTAQEAYLQEKLRILHYLIEEDDIEDMKIIIENERIKTKESNP